MIRAVFSISGGDVNGFSVCGHSGYADSGSDIVCAAVSAMTMLTVNTVTEVIKADAEVECDESDASVIFRLLDGNDCARHIIKGFYCELCALSDEYPDFISVTSE